MRVTKEQQVNSVSFVVLLQRIVQAVIELHKVSEARRRDICFDAFMFDIYVQTLGVWYLFDCLVI